MRQCVLQSSIGFGTHAVFANHSRLNRCVTCNSTQVCSPSKHHPFWTATLPSMAALRHVARQHHSPGGSCPDCIPLHDGTVHLLDLSATTQSRGRFLGCSRFGVQNLVLYYGSQDTGWVSVRFLHAVPSLPCITGRSVSCRGRQEAAPAPHAATTDCPTAPVEGLRFSLHSISRSSLAPSSTSLHGPHPPLASLPRPTHACWARYQHQ